MNPRTLSFEDFTGRQITVEPELFLYIVQDFMGREQLGLGIQLMYESEDGREPYAVLTASFGEFIGIKDCAFIDTNNCPFADQLLESGMAMDTGLTKTSGFCTYPLWFFDKDFLKEIGGESYAQYEQRYEDYMAGDIYAGEEAAQFDQAL